MNTVVDYLEDHAKNAKDKLAIITDANTVSYGQLNTYANNVAACLKGFGLKSQDPVLLFLPNSADYFSIYFGCFKANCCPALANENASAEELKHIISLIDAKVIFYARELEDPLKLALENSKLTPKVVCLGENPSLNAEIYRKIVANAPKQHRLESPDKNTSAVILFDSGKVKLPKGAVVSHDCLLKSAQKNLTEFQIKNNDCLCSFIHFSHYLAHSVALVTAIVSGSQVYVPVKNNKSLHHELLSEKPLIVIGDADLGEKINLQDSLLSWKMIILDHECVQNIALDNIISKYTGKIYKVLGCIESVSIISRSDLTEGSRLKDIDNVIDTIEIRLLDETGMEVFTEEIGELVIKSPHPMLHYVKGPNNGQAGKNNGWVNTGMLCIRNETGNVEILGDKDDIIYKGGFPVIASEVERYIETHPAVKKAALKAVQDNQRNQEIKSYIVIHEGQSLSTDEVIKYCAEKLPKYKHPKEVVFVNELPLNQNGVVIKRLLN